jgi:hypothetical protein
MLRLLQAAPHSRELTLELFGARCVVVSQLGADGVKDGVSDPPLDCGHLIGEVPQGLH